MSRPITIKEIAQKADVSIGTVDRVLHNRGRVSEATREKVLRIAKEGNYTSNIMARQLKLGKTYHIEVVLPKDNRYWSMLKLGIEQGREEYSQLGFSVNYSYVTDSEGRPNNPIDVVQLSAHADGFIIASALLSTFKSQISSLQKQGVPYVLVDYTRKGAGLLTSIGQDAFNSGVLAARLLHEKYLESYHLTILANNSAELQESTVRSRIDGFKYYFTSSTNQNVTINELGLDTIAPKTICEYYQDDHLPLHLFIPNSRSHLMSDQLCRMKNTRPMRIVGYDLLPGNIKLLNDGTLDFLIHQNPQQQGYLSMQSLYKHLILNTEVTPIQYMPIDIITKENVKYCK